MKWSYQKRFEEGTINVFSAPFGYKLSNGSLIINETQAQIVKEIFEMFLNGIGYQRISEICQNKYSSYKDNFSYYGIRYILSNEKYIGDSKYQKTFTTDTLPYRKLPNKGELIQYYIQATHKAIISKETFEKAQALIECRKHKNIVSESPFSGKIICANCGTKYKRKCSGDKIYWVCRRHDNLAQLCTNKRIEEKFIRQSFIILHNKLLFNYKQILIPLQTALQDLKLKKFSGKTQVMDIHKEIAKLREQAHVLARLKTKGFLDEAKYIEQTTELTAKINKLQSELKKLTRSDYEDETLDQIEILIDFFEKRDKPITEFEESAFESIVEKIVVIDQYELEFHLICGLKFKENI